ncbi:universal stress protein [Paracoccus nototheniae]|uniref:Universal stress protein n=1 Tax=Paracoccus nototheniae TaxID=2489002 RepID=A0ABW4E0J7_9RHOB|nr:universal stress protein [Paracoccus nototheniae]
MAYKTLLTVLTDAAGAGPLLADAVALARRHDAHLDVLCLGFDLSTTGYYDPGGAMAIQVENIAAAQAEARDLGVLARRVLDREDIRFGIETEALPFGGIGAMVAARARFADLTVLPRPYGEGASDETVMVLEAALFAGHSPVLVVPPTGLPAVFGTRIVIGWNQTPEALTATRAALPFLQAAATVDITVIAPPRHSPDRSDPGGALAQMLSRHAVRAGVSVLACTLPQVSDVLQRHLHDSGADMLVMGAYGHSRLREAILGGATRTMLKLATVPVLMAH